MRDAQKRSQWFVVLTATVLCLALFLAVLPIVAAEVEIKPRKLVVGKSGKVELVVNPNQYRGTPRKNALYASWCWDIDPRPPECNERYCDPPFLPDPMCAVPEQDASGNLTFEFPSQKALVDKALGACGSTDFVLMTKYEDGSVYKAQGTVEIDCKR
jgi:hypothetical protein